jgi:hypothetical protein
MIINCILLIPLLMEIRIKIIWLGLINILALLDEGLVIFMSCIVENNNSILL